MLYYKLQKCTLADRSSTSDNLLVLSVDWTLRLSEKELHGLWTAGMCRNHQQSVARLVNAELIRVPQKSDAYQLVLQHSILHL